MKQITWARRVDVFDHVRGATTDQLRCTMKSREPSIVTHNYDTTWSVRQTVRSLLLDEADTLLGARFAIINSWRSIAGRVETMPLAFYELSTVNPADLMPVKRVAKDRVGKLQMARFNATHWWFCHPAMDSDEAVLIKTFDSALIGHTRPTIPATVDGPSSAADAVLRQSLETRCFVFY